MRALSGAGVLVALGLATAGCSTSFTLPSLMGKEEPQEITGSIPAKDAPVTTTALAPNQPVSPLALVKPQMLAPIGPDWGAVKQALGLVLTHEEEGKSAPWANPGTGVRGTVTPLGPAHTREGKVCRPFLASFVRPETTQWVKGEACRALSGDWEIRETAPWGTPGSTG